MAIQAETTDQLVRRSVGIRQAERASDLERTRAEAALVRRLVRINQDAYAARAGIVPPDGEIEQEDAVHVGDVVINEAGETAGRVAKSLGPWALAAALGGTGLASVLAARGIDYLRQPDSPSPEPPPAATAPAPQVTSPPRITAPPSRYDIRETPPG